MLIFGNSFNAADELPHGGPFFGFQQPTNLGRESGKPHVDRLASGVNDGIVDGYPRDITRERASPGEQDSAFVRLNWYTPQTIDRVWLFDRPTENDQVTAGRLIFSDGSTLATGALPDDARRGLEVRFVPKTVKWLAFFVTGVKPGSPNIGLSELAVFAAKP